MKRCPSPHAYGPCPACTWHHDSDIQLDGPTCLECGNLMELVRPGKHQCNYCEEKGAKMLDCPLCNSRLTWDGQERHMSAEVRAVVDAAEALYDAILSEERRKNDYGTKDLFAAVAACKAARGDKP